MKKVLILIVLLIGLTGCTKLKGYTEISYQELLQKIENRESFVLVFGSSTCSACAKYKGTMESVIKDEQVEIFYIDLVKLTEDEYTKVDSKFVIKSTPTTIFVEKGVEATFDRIKGAAGYSDVIAKLKKFGYLEDKNV